MATGSAATERIAKWDDRTIRVHIPAGVGYDMKKMQKVTASVLGRLGCEGCHSGWDIRFLHERDFVVNPATLEVDTRFVEGM